MCLLSIVDSLSLPKIKEGNSDSILLFANSNKHKKVAFKIAPSDNSHDNSMGNERQIYMFVKKHMLKLTPHFVAGIEIGKCNQDTLLKLDFFSKNSKFMKQWAQLRGKSIYHSNNKIYKKSQYEFINRENSTDFLDVNYILLPRLKGKSLESILEKNLIPNVKFDIDICIQVAQALCVAEKFKFSHNDLRMGNIFIEVLKTPKTYEYKYPFDFVLTTKYKVHIFDYDFASIESTFENSLLEDEFCDSMGLCNKYVKNSDWRYFLFNFLIFIEEIRPSLLRNFIGQEEAENYIGTGRACVKTSPNRCDIDKKALLKMKSPLQFLEFFV